MTRRVAVLGGTLDPVHNGHVGVLRQVVGLLGADAGLLVPAHTPPHRDAAIVSADLRLEMAAAAVAGINRLCADDLEVRRPGPSYTVDSLETWRERDPGAEYHIVLGADAARLIGTWYRATDLLARGHFVVVNRSGVDRIDVSEARSLGFPQERTRLLQVVSPPVSATAVRAALAAGTDVAEMVPAAVLAIIRREHLYGCAADPVA